MAPNIQKCSCNTADRGSDLNGTTRSDDEEEDSLLPFSILDGSIEAERQSIIDEARLGVQSIGIASSSSSDDDSDSECLPIFSTTNYGETRVMQHFTRNDFDSVHREEQALIDNHAIPTTSSSSQSSVSFSTTDMDAIAMYDLLDEKRTITDDQGHGQNRNSTQNECDRSLSTSEEIQFERNSLLDTFEAVHLENDFNSEVKNAVTSSRESHGDDNVAVPASTSQERVLSSRDSFLLDDHINFDIDSLLGRLSQMDPNEIDATFNRNRSAMNTNMEISATCNTSEPSNEDVEITPQTPQTSATASSSCESLHDGFSHNISQPNPTHQSRLRRPMRSMRNNVEQLRYSDDDSDEEDHMLREVREFNEGIRRRRK